MNPAGNCFTRGLLVSLPAALLLWALIGALTWLTGALTHG